MDAPVAFRLGTLATSVDYRDPTHPAKIAPGVDVISRGRLTLGIGAGYFETEYRQCGWEFPARPAVRIRQMEEAVRLTLAVWTERRKTFHGRYFHVEDAILGPKLVHKSRPLVIIAVFAALQPRQSAVTGAVCSGDRPIPLKAEPIEET